MVSLVIPIYNEEEILPLLHDALVRAMDPTGETWEVVYVNDGSRDKSLELLLGLHERDDRVVIVNLSRNWGHMGAISAGLRAARGDAVVLMDGDLQDPPDVVPKMIEAWRGGAQVVTAVRRTREEHRKYLLFLFPLFYRFLGLVSDYPIPLDAGIFGLMDRQVLDSVNSLREKNRFLPGLRAWVGYRNAFVYYDRPDRPVGKGKLTFMSRVKYATDAICSFSYKPLRLSFGMGLVAMVMALAVMTAWLLLDRIPMGASPGAVASIFFVGGMVLFALGIVGEYIGRIYDEVRDRPLSIVNTVHRRAAAPQSLARPANVMEAPVAAPGDGQIAPAA